MIKQVLHSFGGLASSVLVMLYLLTAIFASLIVPYDPLSMCPTERLQPPSFKHWAGTDQFGRDVFSRLVFGARYSLLIAVLAVGMASTLGSAIGVFLGYLGGKIDLLIMRAVDIIISIPPLILALAIVAFLGSSLYNIALSISITYVPIFVRMTRGVTLYIRELDFVQAVRALGAGHVRIMTRHIIPNVFPTLLTQTTLAFSWAILTEASLSFLGLGIQPPTPSWGAMLAEAKNFMFVAPWTSVFPGVTITLLVIAINLLGDRLRDVLDPRLRGKR